jgi:hypothetical protein
MNTTIKQFELTHQDLEKLVGTNDMISIPESDYGLADVYHTNGKFEVYGIPMYGGEPQLEFVDSNAQLTLSYIQKIC